METRRINYFYPTSDYSRKFRMKNGGWMVEIVQINEFWKLADDHKLKAFPTLAEALAYQSEIPIHPICLKHLQGTNAYKNLKPNASLS